MILLTELAVGGLQKNNSDACEVGFFEVVALDDRRLR